jgi:hypothetical protein
MHNADKASSWWERIKRHWVAISITIFFVLLVTIALIILIHIFGWEWTGFNGGFSKKTVTEEITKSSQGKHTTTKEQPPAKTLWDWLQLLIVPVILAIGGFWLNQIQKSREQRITEQRDKTERGIASDNQREAALQAYIDKISELLLTKNLRTSTEDEEVRKIARVHTLTVLPRLDKERKRSVLQFLFESGLINKDDKRIINLEGADFWEVNLSNTTLSEANLSGANLSGANLSGANLSEANLSKALQLHFFR